jgi:hypothetical protein
MSKTAVLFFLFLPFALLSVVFAADGDTQGQAIPVQTTAMSSSAATAQNAGPESTPLIQYGFEERIRSEHWNNVADYNTNSDDERNQVRFRTKAWLSVNTNSVDFALKFNNEFKKQTVPSAPLNNDEALIETLYLDFKKLPIKGLSFRIGRQDIMRGEGFVLFDGTSGDGSRTSYFNAVDLSYSWKKSKLELIGILDPRQERFLPLIHDQARYLQEWDEQALGLYYSDRNHKATDVDAYYFYKKEVNDFRAPTNALFQPDRQIHTLGARMVRRLNHGVTVTGEFAGQWGTQHANPAVGLQTADIKAWGGYSYVKKSFQRKLKPYILGGVWALSGTDSSTPTQIGGFDPIFSRWPKWSDLYIYSEVPEKGVAYWTNNRMFQAEAGFTPWKPVTFRATLYEEDAFHPSGATPTVFGTGKHRGEDMQIRMDYTINENLRGHIVYESMAPGDFYKVQSNGYFFRAEITYQFKGRITKLSR